MLLIYRAIFILLDLADAIQISQNCRLGNHSFRSKLSGMGQMLSVLLVRSLKNLLFFMMQWKVDYMMEKFAFWKNIIPPKNKSGFSVLSG